jgi:DnaK suppressor protein
MSAILTPDFSGLLHRREAELRAFLRAAAVAAVGTAGEPHARELAQIREALRRIDDGSYGLCLDCGDPIEERRLLALPATAYCTSCQSINERRPATRR